MRVRECTRARLRDDDHCLYPAQRRADDDGGVGSFPSLDETFDGLVFDWEGTAVVGREADASHLRRSVEALCRGGVHVFVVSGTNVGDVDGQLRARPEGRGRLYLCCNRGSEVFEVTERAPVRVGRREATAAESRALDRAAALTVEQLRERRLDATVVSGELNRRTIDLIPLPERRGPKRADTRALLLAVSHRLAACSIQDLAEVVRIATEAAQSAGLPDARITSDVKRVEIGLTDKSDAARFAAGWLADRGVTGRLVLVVGDEFGSIGGVAGNDSLMVVDTLARARVVSVGVEPCGVPEGVLHAGGGPPRLLELLDDQLQRRASRRVPQVDADPSWVVVLPADPAKERVAEALGALGNGWAGMRGSREDPGPEGSPLFAVAGAYEDDGLLLHGPIWTDLAIPAAHGPQPGTRLVDLRTGTLARLAGGTALRSVRFLSAASPHVMALRAEGRAAHLGPAASGLAGGRTAERPSSLARSGRGRHQVVVASADHLSEQGERAAVERIATWETGVGGRSLDDRAAGRLAKASSLGFDGLLAEHRAAWARRWRDAEIEIGGSAGAEEDQLAARFAGFHLLCSAADAGEAAVGARGLTGDAYGGHVFWDADVFVLPALAALHPRAARAMLEYRVRRLPAARAEAAARGMLGARFPWESAGDGSDVTPRVVRGPRGEPIPIRTGIREEHIVADVAWAAACYAAWTGDQAYVTEGPGRDLIVETARYWSSRIRVDRGRAHLYGVMGPDEYHETVDDNAFTNVMARWNLSRGAELLAPTGRREDGREAAHWRQLAASLVDGWDRDRELYEQFSGYFDLEPLLAADVARAPFAADVLLGASRVARSQLIKQADVLMLHHLLPTAVVPGSLAPCLDFYEPRTAHGSSLSPAVSASLLARAGRPDRALMLYRLAARLDLDDLTGTTAGGLHLATMGGVWQALAYGFLGLRALPQALMVDPHLPGPWSVLSLGFHFRGQRVTVRATHHDVTVRFESALTLVVAGKEPEEYAPPCVVVALPPPDARRTRP